MAPLVGAGRTAAAPHCRRGSQRAQDSCFYSRSSSGTPKRTIKQSLAHRTRQASWPRTQRAIKTTSMSTRILRSPVKTRAGGSNRATGPSRRRRLGWSQPTNRGHYWALSTLRAGARVVGCLWDLLAAGGVTPSRCRNGVAGPRFSRV